MNVMENIREKENVMRNDNPTTTTRMIASVFAATVLMFAVASTYAQDNCSVTCKNGDTGSWNEATKWECEKRCDTLCVEYALVKVCTYEGVKNKGTCKVKCKGDSAERYLGWNYAADAQVCRDKCNTECGGQGVEYCTLMNQIIKGNQLPALSAWGLVSLVVLLVAGGAVVFGRRRRVPRAG